MSILAAFDLAYHNCDVNIPPILPSSLILLSSVLLSTIVGTTLCSGAANAINQLMEIPFDSQVGSIANIVTRPNSQSIVCRFRVGSGSHASGRGLKFGLAQPFM